MEDQHAELLDFLEEAKDVSTEVKEEVRKWIKSGPTIRILVTGKTGTGKSTLLNGIIGKKEFAVGKKRGEHCTTSVDCREGMNKGVKYIVWDSPGLQDGTENEQSYLQEMVDKCEQIDIMMYCISMIETRSDLGQEFSAMKKISEAFGPKIWENTVFILTYANVFERRLVDQQCQNVKDDFIRAIRQWRDKVALVLREASVPEDIIQNLKFCPAGRANNPHFGCQKHWFSTLWVSIFATCKDLAAQAMLVMNAKRLVSEAEAESKPEAYTKPDLSSQPIVVDLSTKEKALLTAGTSIATGATGATVGALIGALAIGIPTFGVAAGVGLGLGGLLGAGVGVGVGVAVTSLVGFFRKKLRRK